MDLKKVILTNNDCYKRGLTIKPKGVMWHSTGANNPYIKRYVQPDVEGIGYNKWQNDWNHPGLDVCVHAFIGKLDNGSVAVVQTLPWNHRGWHCYKGRNGSGNDTHIAFEICEDDKHNREYFMSCWRSAVELTAGLCKLYDLNPLEDGVVIDHGEGHKRGIASVHVDVQHWSKLFGKTMDDARREVDYFMKHGYHEGEEPKVEKTFKDQFDEMRKELQDNDAGDWSAKAHEWAVKEGIINGIGYLPDGSPNYAWEDFVTREQLVTILYRTLHQGV